MDEWWKRGVIYQIYPRSYFDTNGDGVGDLAGVRRRLDYLVDLGVDAIWLSPIYPSPMADFGYDISDYENVDPVFGSLETFDALVADTHARGLKIILDFVPNHTSDQHPWFQASRSAKDDPKRDWYIWRDAGPNGKPPNNWRSNFGGSAWRWEEKTRAYYYHAFLRQQPDLNWRNRAVRAAMLDVLRFWMRRGVDGFRVDVLWHLMKDPLFRDNPSNTAYRPGQPDIERFLQTYSADHSDILDVVAELRACVDEFPDRVLIGEIYLPIERLMAYYGRDMRGAHLPFNFQLLDAAWSAASLASIITSYEAALPALGWPNWVLGNHDRPRIAARIGEAQAPLAAMLLLTLRGTPTMYYGDELGIARATIPPTAVQDPWEKREPGLGLGRDPSRTPMLWDLTPNAGFTEGRPWLPLSDNWEQHAVSVERGDDSSILSLYRKLLALRRGRAVLQTGAFRLIASDDNVLIYERFEARDRLIIALNLSHDARPLPADLRTKPLVLASRPSAQEVWSIAGNAGVILQG